MSSSSSPPPRLQSPVWRQLASLQLPLLLLLSSMLLPGRLVGASLLLGNESNPLQRRMASSHQHSAHTRKFGTERLSHAEEFNRTKVLQPEYQIRATLSPNDVSQFYYLGPHESGSPPTLLVSPCSGPISWSVSYVGPPDADQHAEGSQQQQSHWPVNQLVPSLPLFKYEGAETRNFTIPAAVTNLYLIEMQPISSPDFVDVRTRAPNTVLMYATSDALGHLPSSLITPTRSKRHQPLLEFQQKWSRRRLIVSWNKNQIEPASSSSSYLLAVTTSGHLHPPTLCTAENILKKHPCPSSDRLQAQDAAHRPEPEGLHCVPRNRITLKGVKYNTTYYFTLYIMNTHNNVSSRVAMDSFRFERKPPIILQSGRHAIIDLAKSDGFALFRYRPRDNATTLFDILACGVCSIKMKIRGPGYCLEEQISGEFRVRTPALPAGKRFSIQLAASQLDLSKAKTSKVKILAIDNEAVPFNDYILQNSAASSLGGGNQWEYRSLRKCRAKSASWCASHQRQHPSQAYGDRRRTTDPTHSFIRPCPASLV
ncbi:uncharacterized protein LOC106651044 [Trichogramma pretiosum]|uniref:uncharacterized protein LOC106651044 n=1 Tax=Trichogramma pretiosum TaxID=7493 RepID=UPI000C71B8BE|nr:uncharacterized protein LOC106651044 [Trichogramma pretiosum]